MAAPVLEIVLLSGPGAGRRASFTAGPVSFGRDADNTLILGESHVSRKHGEFRLQDDQWVLANFSPNGTRLSRRQITTRPRAVRCGDVVRVADVDLFRVELLSATGAPAGGAAPARAAGAAVPTLQQRSRLWLVLGTSLVVSLGIFVYLAIDFLGKAPDSTRNGSAPAFRTLGKVRIEELIRSPLTGLSFSEVDARKALTAARKAADDVPLAKVHAYRAYRAYQEAMAYARRPSLDEPADAVRFAGLQKLVAEDVSSRYEHACTLLRANDFGRAEREFEALAKDVQVLFGGSRDNDLYRSIIELQIKARSAQPKG